MLNIHAEYCIYGLVVFYLLALIVAKWRSPFWFHQPVHHRFEWYPLWCSRPYLKRKKAPRPGIYCEPSRVYTTDTLPDEAVVLLQGHYLDNDAHLYEVTHDSLQRILHGTFYVSCYCDVRRIEPTYQSILDTSCVQSMITSRPIELRFRAHPDTNVTAHFLDHICTHESVRTKHLSRPTLQTHVYNHHQQDPQFSGVYLFRKEVDLCIDVVPLVLTNAYTFLLHSTSITKLPIHYSLRRLNSDHVDVWRTVYAEMLRQFEITALPEMAYTIDWLKNERYSVYLTVYKTKHLEHIHGVYVFEDSGVLWQTNEAKPRMVRLAASMRFSGEHDDPDALLFFRGFLHALRDYVTDRKTTGVLEIPCISHNGYLLSKWREKYALRNETLLAYYLYNMVHPSAPLSPEQILCLA